jgi:hypothetical protein
MPENQLTKILPLIFFTPLLLISFFFNYISALYSEADLFKLDLTKGRKTIKIKKLLFILKRGQILSATVSFYQVMLNFFMSLLATKVVRENKELLNKF